MPKVKMQELTQIEGMRSWEWTEGSLVPFQVHHRDNFNSLESEMSPLSGSWIVNLVLVPIFKDAGRSQEIAYSVLICQITRSLWSVEDPKWEPSLTIHHRGARARTQMSPHPAPWFLALQCDSPFHLFLTSWFRHINPCKLKKQRNRKLCIFKGWECKWHE